jgi:hypothetical protein
MRIRAGAVIAIMIASLTMTRVRIGGALGRLARGGVIMLRVETCRRLLRGRLAFVTYTPTRRAAPMLRVISGGICRLHTRGEGGEQHHESMSVHS